MAPPGILETTNSRALGVARTIASPRDAASTAIKATQIKSIPKPTSAEFADVN